MDDISIFPDKLVKPEKSDLRVALDSSYDLWIQIEEYVMKQYLSGLSGWNYPDKKYG